MDDVDLFIINTSTNNHFGQFIFPKSILCERNIVSFENQAGKRARHIYPPWEININSTAQKTQKWQLKYFLDLSPHVTLDYSKVKDLYGLV